MAVGTVLPIFGEKKYWLAVATGATLHRSGAKGKATSSMILQSFTVSRWAGPKDRQFGQVRRGQQAR